MKSSIVYSSSVQQSSVLCGPVQSCPAHPSPVPSTQVHCDVFPSGTPQVHERQLQQSSSVKCCPVLSCPVLSSPVQAYPLNYSAVYFNLERNVKRNALRLSQVKYNLKQYGAAIRVKCHSENATFSSQSAQSGPVTAV